MTADRNPTPTELVTFTDIARRVSELELTPRPISRQGVRYIAEHDPNWPVPRDQWVKIGNAWALPWEPIRVFFEQRTKRGRGPSGRWLGDAEPEQPPAGE